MNTTTIYRIKEKDRTIDIAQSVKDTDFRAAVLNTRTYTFDELMNQHKIFREHIEPLENFRNRLNSALRIGRSISVDTSDMIGRFTSEHGENNFSNGFVREVIELYDNERQALLKPNDVIIGTITRSKLQTDIAEKIGLLFDRKLKLLTDKSFFDHNSNIRHYSAHFKRTVIASDEFTFGVFRESDNSLLDLLFEIGQLVHRNKWTECECVFCHKLFLNIDGEVCCSNTACKEAQQTQKETIYRESTKEYADIKRSYDAYVRRYKSYLVTARIDTLYPDKFDEFIQAKEERQAEMSKLKRKLINYGLPSEELYELGEKFKREIRIIVERIIKCE